jgi:SPP1 family phage portal protein
MKTNLFDILATDETSYSLGNGVTLQKSQNKEKLGDDFDKKLYQAGYNSITQVVAYLFWNYDHVEIFENLEFAQLQDEKRSSLRAGVRWWQIDDNKPLRATLYEEDGYTELVWRNGQKAEVLAPKRSYRQIKMESVADGVEIVDGSNYPGFPIVPLWANKEHQSELVGIRDKIDGYDLIQSGFANTVEDASEIYWTINNAGGMDEKDLAAFIDQIRRVKAAVVEDEGANAVANTLNIPYQARQAVLADIRDSLYRDAMALDTDKISAGNITATAINAAYENLELKCDGYEYCVTDAINELLKLIGVEDSPTYHRRKTTNQAEATQMVLSAAQYLDSETILKHLPFLNIDEIENIMKKMVEEEKQRFEVEKEMNNNESDAGNG